MFLNKQSDGKGGWTVTASEDGEIILVKVAAKTDKEADGLTRKAARGGWRSIVPEKGK